MIRRGLALLILLAAAPAAFAHPVPRGDHDRTIKIHLAADKDQFVVTVAYRLEVDEYTVLLDDLGAVLDKSDLSNLQKKPGALYQEFTRVYGPILANHLRATVDDKKLNFDCIQHEHTLRDEKGQALGHLRCDFVFRAAVPLAPGATARFQFREGNYLLQEGLIDITLSTDGRVGLKDIVIADEVLKKLESRKRKPGDEDRLREVSATLTMPAQAVEAVSPPDTGGLTAPARQENSRQEGSHLELTHLFFESDYSLFVLLLLAAFIGAAHALTPGHGKTLVAAYLVGENGTVWHAIVLGLVTTLTHTGAVLILALLMRFVLPGGDTSEARAKIQSGLGLAMGVLIVCMGFWLLLKRASGGADHVHLPGTAHHHHGPGGHHHHAPPPGGGWRGLILLGVNGGIIPCWDAIAVLAWAIGRDYVWLAFPLVLAFSAGLASVLVLLGIIVVRVKRLAQSHWGEGRIVRALPIASAVCVIGLGFYLCYTSLNAAKPVEASAAARP